MKSRNHFADAAQALCMATFLLAASATAQAAPVLPPQPLHSAQFPYPNWKDNSATNTGRVECLLRVGQAVYVGGDLIDADDRAGHLVARHGLAAVDATSGRLLDFAPNFNGRVNALAASADGSTLLVGGEFTTLDGKPAPHLAAIDLKTSTTLPLFEQTPIAGPAEPGNAPPKLNRFGHLAPRNGVGVLSILSRGADLWIGGDFNAVAGKERFGLAKLTLADGKYTLADWAPLAQMTGKDPGTFRPGRVKTLCWDEARQRIIAGGFFTAINGDAKASRLAALDPNTGKVAMLFQHLPDWSGKPFPFAEVIAAAVDGDALYVAMGGPGGTALAYHLNDGKLNWFYQTDGNVQAAAVVDGYPVFGHHGDFLALKKNTYMKEYAKGSRMPNKKIFMLSPDGVVVPNTPVLDRLNAHLSPLGVFCLSSAPGFLYVGGDFTAVGTNKSEQQRFAIFPLRAAK